MSLAGLNLGGTTHTIPGTYVDTWTFTDVTGNYNNASGTVTDSISIAGSIFVLDKTAGGALTLSGNASINVPGRVYVDSSSSSALSASGNASITASAIDVHGGVQKTGNPSFSPAPVTGTAVVADPLASLPLPGAPSLTNYGSESVSGNSVATIGPGIYSQISVSGNAQLTMTAGTYIIQAGGFTASGNAVIKFGTGSYILEGGGLSVSGDAAISGTGVTIFNVGSSYNPSNGTDGGTFGAVTLGGNGAVSLTPSSSGTYAGILIYQARDNAKALTFNGNAMQGITGTIYAAAAQLAESGNAQIGSSSNPISIVVDTLSISGNGVADAVALNSPSGTAAYTPAQIRTAISLANVNVSVIDHAIEIDFGSGGIGANPNTTAADGYYELDIVLPDGQTAIDHFYRMLGDVNGDGIVDQNDLNEIAMARIQSLSQIATAINQPASGLTPLSMDVNGDGSVNTTDLALATKSKGNKLGTGLPLG